MSRRQSRDFEQVENWTIDQIDRKRAKPTPENKPDLPPRHSGFTLWDVAVFRTVQNLRLLEMFRNSNPRH